MKFRCTCEWRPAVLICLALHIGDRGSSCSLPPSISRASLVFFCRGHDQEVPFQDKTKGLQRPLRLEETWSTGIKEHSFCRGPCSRSFGLVQVNSKTVSTGIFYSQPHPPHRRSSTRSSNLEPLVLSCLEAVASGYQPRYPLV